MLMMRKAADGRLRQVVLLLGLIFLVAAAVVVWTHRFTPLAGAGGEKHYEDLVYELDQKLRAEHGDVCGELISLLPDGKAKPHGLDSGDEMPIEATNMLIAKFPIGLEVFERRAIDVNGVTLISEDRTSEVLSGGREVLGEATKITYLTGGGKGVDRWEITDIAHFYPCSPPT